MMNITIRPLKKWSQNFLKNKSISKQIVDSLHIQQGDQILEIGPGKGALTQFLITSKAKKILGIEVDSRLVDYLNIQFKNSAHFQVIQNNILEFNFQMMNHKNSKKWRVIGNLPYSITTPILFFLLENKQYIQDCILTMQKEVGERIISPPGSKIYGIPSVIFQLFCDCKKLFLVPPKAFKPIPDVRSMVVYLKFLEHPRFKLTDSHFFFKMVRTLFSQRRKTLKNNLKNLKLSEAQLNLMDINLNRRPETLSIKEFVDLSNQIVVFQKNENGLPSC